MEGLKNKMVAGRIMTWRRRVSGWFAIAPLALFSALIPLVAGAQAVTTYTYDALQRVTGASVQNGTSVQYAYDPDGNLTSITRANGSSTLSDNQPVDINLNVLGQSASFTFSITGNGTAEINLGSISTSPPGSSITVAVYNSNGTLVSSTTETGSATLPLSGQAAGSYTVVLSPPSSGTASLQLSLVQSTPPDMGDAPLPTWAYVLLAAGFLLILARRHPKSTHIAALCVSLMLSGLIGASPALANRLILVLPTIIYTAGDGTYYPSLADAISTGEQYIIQNNAGTGRQVSLGSPVPCASDPSDTQDPNQYINGVSLNWCVLAHYTRANPPLDIQQWQVVASGNYFCPQPTSTLNWSEPIEDSASGPNGNAHFTFHCSAVEFNVSPQTAPHLCATTTPCSDGSGGSGGGFGNPIFGEDGTKREAQVDYEAPDGLLTFERLYRSDRGGFYNNFRSEVGAPIQETALSGTPDYLPADCYGGESTAQQGTGGNAPHIYEPCFEEFTANGTTGEVDLTTPAGFMDEFTWSGTAASSNSTSMVDHLSQVSINGNTVWLWTRSAEGILEEYNMNWQLLKRQYKNGQTVTLTYSDGSTPVAIAPGPGYLIAATSVFGRQLSFTYDSDGRLTTMTSPGGAVTKYGYADPDPGAQTPCGPGGCSTMASVTYPDGSELQYLWNETPDITNPAQNAPALLTGIVDESGQHFATFTYNGPYAVSTQHTGGVNHYAFSGFTPYQQVTVTDPLNTPRTYQYTTTAGLTELQQKTQPAASGTGTAASRSSYDSNGNLQTATDFVGNVSCYAYDTTRNLETIRLEGVPPGGSCPANLNGYQPPSGSTQRLISTSWHPNWPLPVERAEPGRIITWVYNGEPDPTAGGATASCAPTSAALDDGEPLVVLCKLIEETTTDPTGGQGLWAGGQPGVPVREWQWTYNSTGQAVSETDPRGNVTLFSYYGDTTSSHTIGDLDTIKDAAGHVTTYTTYDADGRPLTVADPNGVVTTFAYDARGRLTSSAVGAETASLSYYSTGLLEQVTLPDGSTVSYAYDAAHRLTQVSDGLGDRIVYTIDAMGNRTAEKSYDPSGTLFRTHTRVVSQLNEIYQEIDAAGTPEVTTTIGYDNNGNRTSVAAPLGENTTESYDALNRLIQIKDPADAVSSLGYDAEDDVTTVTDPRTLGTVRSYDGFGDLTSEVSPDRGTTNDTYDSIGNLANSTDARGAVATYTYDALNRISSVAYSLGGNTDQTLSFSYDQGTDGTGHLTGASDANHSMSWSYDPQGRVTQMTQTIGGIAKTVQYGYVNGDLTSLTTPSGQEIGYQYSNHRITAITVNGTQLLSGVTYAPFGPVTGWHWGNGSAVSRNYDGDGRVTSSTTGGYSASYSYRPDGTLESATENAPAVYSTSSGTISVSVTSANNRIGSVSGAASGSYQYDAAGDTLSDGTRTFTYNDAGRLATATDGGISTTYLYNAVSERMEKSNSNGTTYFVYDEAGHLLGEYDASGTLIEELVWLNDTPVASLRPNQSGGGAKILYVGTDFLNAPTELTDSTGNKVVWRWDHDPYGNGAALEDPSGTGADTVFNLRFPGQYYDQETALVQNGLRDYDPTLGRYVESDPIGLAGGSYLLYSYASGNPITHFDPTGLDCLSSGGRTTCTYPGGPAFSIPTPPNFPAYIGPKDLLYHHYEVSVSEACLDNKMTQGLVNDPAPGKPMSPATTTGTHNIAQALGVNNPIISYVTNDLVTGNQIVVNVTTGTQLQGFSPGYVARTVSNGVVHNYGEGEAIVQSPLVFSPQFLLDQYVWRTQTGGVAKDCGCNN